MISADDRSGFEVSLVNCVNLCLAENHRSLYIESEAKPSVSTCREGVMDCRLTL